MTTFLSGLCDINKLRGKYPRNCGSWASITGIKFKYSTYDISKMRVYTDGLGSFKIILKGKVSGKVSGKKITRSFKYEGKVTFL